MGLTDIRYVRCNSHTIFEIQYRTFNLLLLAHFYSINLKSETFVVLEAISLQKAHVQIEVKKIILSIAKQPKLRTLITFQNLLSEGVIEQQVQNKTVILNIIEWQHINNALKS